MGPAPNVANLLAAVATLWSPARHQIVDASHTEKFVCLVENNRFILPL